MNDACYIPSRAEPRAASGPWNILVVDDEDPVRELVSYVLESHGFTVFRARHSREALHLHSGFKGVFHLLVTDICMKPHEDGFDLARAIRRERPDVRIIYSSGFVEPERLQREVDGSGALFLPKPFTMKQLVETVKAAMG